MKLVVAVRLTMWWHKRLINRVSVSLGLVWWHHGIGLAINRLWILLPLRQSCITTLGKLFTPCASVIKQYNLILVEEWWRSLAVKVIACLVGSNGSQWNDLKSPAGWLLVHRVQLRAQHSVTSMGELYLCLFSFCICFLNSSIDMCMFGSVLQVPVKWLAEMTCSVV